MSASDGNKAVMIDTVHAIGSVAAEALTNHRELIGDRNVRLVERGDWPEIAPELEAVLALKLPERDWNDAHRLRLVQAMSVGTDQFLPLPGLRDDVIIATASGLSAAPMAEFAATAFMMLAKDFPGAAALQAQRRWQRTEPLVIAGQRVVILGAGPVGLGTAERLAAFGVNVVAVCRRPRPLPNVAETVGVDRMDDILPSADGLIIALPLNHQTRHVIGPQQIDLLPAHAVIVNVARGGLIDEPALERALRAGRLRGAVLDVTETEPLPADSSLWTCPRMHLTAHVSWTDPDYVRSIVALFAENVVNVESGRPIRNAIDRDLGYPVS